MAKKKKAKRTYKSNLLLSAMLLASVAVLPTTILLFFGLLPTIVARFVDQSHQKNRTLTIGFINFAACFPFWYDLVRSGHTFDKAVEIMTDPVHIVIMYAGALAGYLIDWGLGGIVATLMVQKGHKRLKEIEVEQKKLIERWGEEVSGTVPLDQFGFPVENSRES